MENCLGPHVATACKAKVSLERLPRPECSRISDEIRRVENVHAARLERNSSRAGVSPAVASAFHGALFCQLRAGDG
jgi:hypothetical protein